MFTLKLFKQSDDLHVGYRVGVEDARVHHPEQPKPDPTLTATLLTPDIDILLVINEFMMVGWTVL